MARTKLKNKFEKELYKLLKKKKKIDVQYESERIPYTISGDYIPDFILTSLSGLKKIYIEAKGHFRPEAKRKMAAVKKLHPHLDIRFVFYSKKVSDIKFADKHGFPYAIGSIPSEWVEELNA